MKKVWVKVIPWQKKLVTTAIEGGADAIVVEEGKTEAVKALGRMKTVAADGDIKIDKDVVFYEIKSKEDEEKILKLTKEKIVVVTAKDWKIIPLENLVAQTTNLFAEASTAEEARTLLGILERGVDGVVVNTKDISEVKKILDLVKRWSEKIEVKVAKVKNIKQLGMGYRVCVDTCDLMAIGEGMLVGNSSGGLFLVHAENVENPYVTPRPFRVNAGPVHAYIRVIGGKTKYLSELKAGDEVLIVNHQGETRPGVVGRVKVERRPLLLVEAEVEGETISTILQNAETIRLTTPKGKPISVVQLKPGDEVVVAIEKAGRHFGIKVEETIMEK
ncbi:MAG: 3-dehydroquinate synthase II [Candidatus Desulfofervidus auxilii]|nr:3-dehydroquinate synthase II [Candidatus Desulfofervidus auxilii]